MLPHLRQILNTLGVLVLPGQVSVPNAHEAFDTSGALKSAERIKTLVAELIKTASALNPPESA
jgi:NAD(P)H-dependent FMN reductase